MPSEKLVLSSLDYAIFAATLLVSSAIGVYFQLVAKKTTEEYLLGGRSMSLIPVAFSLMATFMSATSLMGLPADVYLHGTNMPFMNIGFVVGPILSAYVFLPIFFQNNFTTAYEYLEKRFGKVIRRFVSAMFAVQTVLFTSATLYAPALALSAVTDLSLWTSIITIGTVCTFYSALGGLKAVLWTDVFQAVLMYSTLILIIVIGCSTMGLGSIFEIANDGGRMMFPSLHFDLSQHYTFYNIFSQSMVLSLSAFGGSQISLQRLMAVKSLQRSRMATFLFIPMLVSFHLMCCMCGLVFYAYFRSCDPMTSPNPPILSADQLMPLFVTSSMSHLPGLPGLCVAGIFSASLSTVSSALNSLAAVTYEDFLLPITGAKRPLIATKIISVLFGCLCIGLSFAMTTLGNLIRLTIVIVGLFAGPNLAVFILASCTTTTNQAGALIGLVASLAVGSYFSFQQRKPEPPLPLSNQCPLVERNITTLFGITDIASPVINAQEEGFHLAYMWFSTLGLLTCLIVGFIASAIIAAIRGKEPDVPEMFLSPVRTWFFQKKSDTWNPKSDVRQSIKSIQVIDVTKL